MFDGRNVGHFRRQNGTCRKSDVSLGG